MLLLSLCGWAFSTALAFLAYEKARSANKRMQRLEHEMNDVQVKLGALDFRVRGLK